MATTLKQDQQDAIAEQFWRHISERELRSWPEGLIESAYAWFRGTAAKVTGETVLMEIDVHDDTTIVTVVSKDCPFIIDSLTALVQRMGFSIVGLIHPVIKDPSLPQNLSLVSIRTAESLSAVEATNLGAAIDQVMQDVMLATRDWREMRHKMEEVLTRYQAGAHAEEEEGGFLRYLIDNNFTFLGYAVTGPNKRQLKDGLGVLSKDRRVALIDDESIPIPVTPHPAQEQGGVVVFKLPLMSNVHRPVRLDVVTVRLKDKKDQVIEEHVFIGLFTSVTYSRSIKDVPLLRSKAQWVIDQSGFDPDHHDFKALVHILEKYPRDELFRIDLDTLARFTHGIMRLQERQRIALFTRHDKLTSSIFALLYIPRDRFDSRLRAQIVSILEREFGAVCEGFITNMDDSPLVRLLITLHASNETIDVEKTERILIEETRSWHDHLRGTLPRDLAARYDSVFPINYQTKYGTSTLVNDVQHIENVIRTGKIALELYRPAGYHANRMRFKIFVPDGGAPLSDVLPLLENFGLRVNSERPFELFIAEKNKTVWLHDFSLTAKDEEAEFDIQTLRPIFEEAFTAVWYGAAASDDLNRLIARAQMNVRQVMILRAFCRYLHQIRIPFSPAYVLETLGQYPCLSLKLIQLFEAMFDPAIDVSVRYAKIDELRAKIEADLSKVASLDQDTILRRVLNLINCTFRTNAYQRDEQGNLKTYISFKFDCANIIDMPEPRPRYEIFVKSGRVEGVHLRGGDVARGGIRWSDRLDDFRTEILGLVKAQMVKNAVIVPTGAKGGFVVKRPPVGGDRAALQREGIECYKIFIRGLLDITDNRQDGQIIPPKDVVRYDHDDTYLVVAADKGTASFSDTANELSAEYGFWLGDAFASGGSAGYDHKELAITARGAWESVKRHFREMGKDIQTTPFTVIGVGDMGGDVFGNGMLLSPQIKLIGAFNHMHIFCDPTPDVPKTYIERKRLFDAVKGWGDYDAKLLSKGGRIYLRSDKVIDLTPEIKQAFGIEADSVAPSELIQAMLKADVELLYFGGIGTYIKDEMETQADVSDKANDRLRINAQDVRARVIGEGANLGITQTARISMSKQGVRLNTDFIDNSGGVDCSDHEVNIKILLAQLGDALPRAERDALLESMTSEVCTLVLKDNYQQSLAITLASMKAAEYLPQHALTIQRLQNEYGLNRKLEQLPSVKELMDRQNMGQGLTRPEVSVILAYAKMTLTQEIVNSDIPDKPYALVWLETYFPDVLQRKYRDALLKHPLRREIIATQIANSIVNRMGPQYVFVQQEQSGLSIATVVDAYIAGRDILNLHAIWRSMELLDGEIDASVQLRLLSKSIRALDRLTWRLLNIYGERLRTQDAPLHLKDQLNRLLPRLLPLLSDDLRRQYDQRMSQLRDQKVAKGVAEAATMLPYAVMACDALQLVDKDASDEQIDRVMKIFFMVGGRFRIDTLRQQSRYLASEKPDQADALYGVVDSLWNAQIALTQQVLQDSNPDIDEAMNDWIASHAESIQAIDRITSRAIDMNALDLAQLVLLEQKIRMLSLRS